MTLSLPPRCAYGSAETVRLRCLGAARRGETRRGEAFDRTRLLDARSRIVEIPGPHARTEVSDAPPPSTPSGAPRTPSVKSPWTLFASLIPHVPEAARVLRTAAMIAPLAFGASNVAAFDYSHGEWVGGGPSGGTRIARPVAQPAEAIASQGRGQNIVMGREAFDRTRRGKEDTRTPGARVQGQGTEPHPLTTEVPQVPPVGNSWTAQAGIPLVVSGSYRSPRYSVIDAILGARLSSLAYEPFLTAEEKAAFLTKLAQDPILAPHGFRVVYWIDDRQQHEACANEEAKRTIPEFARHCRELPSTFLPVRDSQAVLLVDRQGHITAVARGTESWTDILTDVLFLFRWDWGSGGVHPGYMRAYQTIRPYWPVVADFMARRRVAPETLEEAVAVEFSPNIAAPLRSEAVRPRAARGNIMAEWNRLTEPQKALLYLLSRLAKMDDDAVAKRYGLNAVNVSRAVADSEVRRQRDPAFARITDTIERALLGFRFTGHSLGAVLSTIASRDTVEHGFPVTSSHFFGSPRVFDTRAARDFDAAPNFSTTLGEVTFRHVAGFDIVAHLFPYGFGYKHVATGQERQYLKSDLGTYDVHIGLNREQKRKWFFDALRREALGTLFEILGDALDQHRVLESYEHVLGEVAKQNLALVNAVLVADLEMTVRRQIQAEHPEIRNGVLTLTDGTLVTEGELRTFAAELDRLTKARDIVR
ncbi:MAG: hypothetical protein IPK13_07280 [Deltaproteobacteria bacterium]|nr:hypothetical protein [Deltaproteobacteria bacterium]